MPQSATESLGPGKDAPHLQVIIVVARHKRVWVKLLSWGDVLRWGRGKGFGVEVVCGESQDQRGRGSAEGQEQGDGQRQYGGAGIEQKGQR